MSTLDGANSETAIEYNLIDIAIVCHEANRALQVLRKSKCPSNGIKVSDHWEAPYTTPYTDALNDQIESSVNGVYFAVSGLTPEELHVKWCEEKTERGWVYGPEKDFDKKTHPCLVPYSELHREDLRKDELFAAIVDVMTRP